MLPTAKGVIPNKAAGLGSNNSEFLILNSEFVLPFADLFAQPLTAPTVKPATKYFCTKGYSRMMGPVAMTAVAIFRVSPGRSVMTTLEPAMEFFRLATLLITLYR